MKKANKNKKEPIFHRDELEGNLKEREERLDIATPDHWRKGQTLFNFLEWLHTAKGYGANESGRMADPFHVSNTELEHLYKEFLKVHES